MKTFREFMYEEDNFGQAKKVMRKHSDRLKKLHRQIDKGSGSGEDVNEDKREEKARSRQNCDQIGSLRRELQEPWQHFGLGSYQAQQPRIGRG